MWTLPEAPDVIASLASLLGAAAAFYGVCVAHQGLKTWQKQRDSVLAARLAAVAFKYREALHHVRLPYLTATDRSKFSGLSDSSDVTDVIRLARWQASRDLLDSFQEVVAEADIAWNGATSPCYEAITKMEQKFADDILKLRTLNRRQARDDEALRTNAITDVKWTDEFDGRTDETRRLLAISSGLDSDDTGKLINEAFRPLANLLKSKI